MSVNSNLLVGNDKLDTKHLELFEMLEMFAVALRMREEREYLLRYLNLAQQHVIDCFTYEEELLRKTKHPRYFEHRKHHRLYIEQLMMVKDEVERHGYRAPSVQNQRVLAQWLEAHIINHDKAILFQSDLAV